MGLQDRQYARDDGYGPTYGQYGEQAQPMHVVTKLVIVTVAIWLVDQFVRSSTGQPGVFRHVISEHMALQLDWITRPWEAYKLVTYGFTHAAVGEGSGYMHILGNMFVVWMFGRFVEQQYGAKEFLWFYFSAMIFAGLSWTAVQYFSDGLPTDNAPMPTVIGASGAVVAVLILFVFNNPKQTALLFFVIPVPVWFIGVLAVGTDVISALNPASRVAVECHFAGALFAFLYYKLNWNFSSGIAGKFSFNELKPKPKLKIHRPESKSEKIAEKADVILEKLHREGEASLTNRERKILEDYSRNVRKTRD